MSVYPIYSYIVLDHDSAINSQISPIDQYKKRYQLSTVMKSQVEHRGEEIECGICLMAVSRPVRCRGTCHKWFCFKCAVKAIAEGMRCPNRCSSPFVIQVIPQSQQKFRCPFSPAMCRLPIVSRAEMMTHASLCQFASVQDKQELHQQQTFSCRCGHRLCFLDRKSLQVIYGFENYFYDVRETCNKCKQNYLCRSLCLSCSSRTQRIVYCSNCRPLPCSKTLCPMGHRLKRKRRMAKMRFCDQCDSAAYMVGENAYGYCPCDFDLCEICQGQAPIENGLVPLESRVGELARVAVIQEVVEESEWVENSNSEYMSE